MRRLDMLESVKGGDVLPTKNGFIEVPAVLVGRTVGTLAVYRPVTAAIKQWAYRKIWALSITVAKHCSTRLNGGRNGRQTTRRLSF